MIFHSSLEAALMVGVLLFIFAAGGWLIYKAARIELLEPDPDGDTECPACGHRWQASGHLAQGARRRRARESHLPKEYVDNRITRAEAIAALEPRRGRQIGHSHQPNRTCPQCGTPQALTYVYRLSDGTEWWECNKCSHYQTVRPGMQQMRL